jgi:hypothetical protein
MVNSDTEPQTLQLDIIRRGVARVLVRWDIQQVERVDPIKEEVHTSWVYEEKAIPWILPEAYETTQDVVTYLNSIESEIIGYAQAARKVYGYGDE